MSLLLYPCVAQFGQDIGLYFDSVLQHFDISNHVQRLLADEGPFLLRAWMCHHIYQVTRLGSRSSWTFLTCSNESNVSRIFVEGLAVWVVRRWGFGGEFATGEVPVVSRHLGRSGVQSDPCGTPFFSSPKCGLRLKGVKRKQEGIFEWRSRKNRQNIIEFGISTGELRWTNFGSYN